MSIFSMSKKERKGSHVSFDQKNNLPDVSEISSGPSTIPPLGPEVEIERHHDLQQEKNRAEQIANQFIYFNLNGIRYQITKSTFTFLNPKTLASKAIVTFNEQLNQNEYFFTRNNPSFVAIIEFLENGNLHMPTSICPTVFEEELEFWGINSQKMETCCLRKLKEYSRQEKHLDAFVRSYSRRRHLPKTKYAGWERIRRKVWIVLDEPTSSLWAKLYFAFKVVCVIIFALQSIISTDRHFERQVTDEELIEFIDSNREEVREMCDDNERSQHVDIICDHYQKQYPSSAKRAVYQRDITKYVKDNNAHQIDTKYVSQVKEHKNKSNALMDNLGKFGGAPHQYTFDRHRRFDINYNGSEPGKYKLTAFSKASFEYILNGTNNTRSTNELNYPLYTKSIRQRRSENQIIDVNAVNSNQYNQSDTNNRGRRDGLIPNVRRITSPNDTSDHKALFVTYEWLNNIEISIQIIFTFEYLLELTFAPSKLRYMIDFYRIVDLLNILSVGVCLIYYELNPQYKYIPHAVDFLKVVSSMKILKLFSLVKNFRGFRVLVFAIRYSYKDILCFLVNISILILIVSYCMYYLEQDNMDSIPGAIWWTVMTITTVGYGDVLPKTAVGKALGIVCALSGVLMTAMLVPLFMNDIMIYNKLSKSSDKIRGKSLTLLLSRQKAIPVMTEMRRKTRVYS